MGDGGLGVVGLGVRVRGGPGGVGPGGARVGVRWIFEGGGGGICGEGGGVYKAVYFHHSTSLLGS